MRLERESLLKKIDKFLYSVYYPLSVFILAAIFYILKLEVVGAIVLVAIILFILITHRDTMPTLFPFLLVCVLPLRMYGSGEVWLKLLPLIAIVVPCLIFHFVYYRPKFSLGKMFFPYLAVSVAITLGGLFVVSPKNYFSPTSLYYIVGLGFGMLGLYVLLNAHIATAEKKYDLTDNITKIMLWFGGFLTLMVLVHFIENIEITITNGELVSPQMSNNLSTNLLITMPFAFYYSKKCKYHTAMFMFGTLQYIAMIGTGSRGGILIGSIMFVLCVIYSMYINDKVDRKFMVACVICLFIIGITFVIVKFDSIIETLEIKQGEARLNLIRYAIRNFKNNPVFGVGLAHQGYYYHPQQGGLYWYHSSPLQVIASMGVVGILSYGYQFVARLRMLSKKRNIFTACAMLSFFGLELMSVVNPGIFCPLPYALTMVIIFIVVEKELLSKQNSNLSQTNSI